jgi:hypothetical protein
MQEHTQMVAGLPEPEPEQVSRDRKARLNRLEGFLLVHPRLHERNRRELCVRHVHLRWLDVAVAGLPVKVSGQELTRDTMPTAA